MTINPDNIKVLILDPSCIGDSHSHHLQAVTGHAIILKKAGIKTVLGTNINCGIKYDDIINYPVFEYSIYDEFKNKKNSRFKRFFRSAYYNSLARNISSSIRFILDREKVDKHDHVFVPTLDWLLYKTLLHVFRETEHSPYLHLLLMYEQARWITGGYPYKRITESLKNEIAKNRKLFIYTETGCHAKRLGDILHYQPLRIPYPALPFSKNIPINPVNKIVIGALGGGRRDKGYGRLPEIIMKFNSVYQGNDVMFLVQEARHEDQLSAETKLLGQIKNVTLLNNELPRTDYENYFMMCDITLFPYSSVVYRCRGSGIVNEALANGKPIICSEGTALAESLTSDNGTCAGSTESFVKSAIHIINHLDKYKTNAYKARDRYLQELYYNPLIKNINATLAMNNN